MCTPYRFKITLLSRCLLQIWDRISALLTARQTNVGNMLLGVENLHKCQHSSLNWFGHRSWDNFFPSIRCANSQTCQTANYLRHFSLLHTEICAQMCTMFLLFLLVTDESLCSIRIYQQGLENSVLFFWQIPCYVLVLSVKCRNSTFFPECHKISPKFYKLHDILTKYWEKVENYVF